MKIVVYTLFMEGFANTPGNLELSFAFFERTSNLDQGLKRTPLVLPEAIQVFVAEIVGFYAHW